MKTTLFALITAGSIGVACCACTKQQAVTDAPAVVSTSSCVTKIIADALIGLSRDAILTDVGPACAKSIEEIDSVLNGSTTMVPSVKRSAAYLEMHGAP